MKGISSRLAAASGAVSIIAVIFGSELSGNTTAVGLVLITASFLALVVFIGYLHPLLRRAEGTGGWLATVALVAGTLHAATRFELLAAENGTRALSGALAEQLQTVNEQAFVVSGLLLGLYVACASGVCGTYRVLPRWLGWFGVVAGGLTVVVGTVTLVDTSLWIPWPFTAAALWVLLASVLLAVRAGRGATAPTSAADLDTADLAGAG